MNDQRDEQRLSLCDGKYVITQLADGRMHAFRYGDPWRDLTGDHLIAALMDAALSVTPPAEAQAVASLREMLELLEATQNGRVTEKHELDIIRDARAALSAQPRPEPDGYHYRYPYGNDGSVIRKNNGEEVNGCRPLGSVPYWYAAPQPASAPVGVEVYQPQQGEPPGWFDEWFIAKLDTGDRVVLKRLPEEYTYDYTTADATYFMSRRLKWWMQFPDSEFIQLESAIAQQPAAAEKTLSDALAYVGQRADGDLPTLAERCALWMRESKSLIDYRRHPPRPKGVATQQPAAVDEAMARRLDDYLGGEFDIRIGKQAAHAALTAALAGHQQGGAE